MTARPRDSAASSGGRTMRHLGLALAILCAMASPLPAAEIVGPEPVVRVAAPPGTTLLPADRSAAERLGDVSRLRLASHALQWSRDLGARRTFFDGYLVPRMSRQLESVAPEHLARQSCSELESYVLFDDVTRTTRHRAIRGARRALKSFLLETTPLGRLRDAIARGLPATGSRTRGDVKLGLGVSHGLPELELRYHTSYASLRVDVGVTGRTRVELAHRRMSDTRLVASFDPDEDTIGAACRVRF